ncbi:hypothetical protein [Streptomyces sp. CA-179760]|uniref:hypothetical protein n=1 Tax=Streptomyces sp. CA-179760 TaxID=3240054 RepID=UPI003D94A6FD
MDDIFAMLDELLLDLGDAESVSPDIDFGQEAHWAPVEVPAQLPTELTDLLELSDSPSPSDPDTTAAAADGVKWVTFPNPFRDDEG